MLGACNATPIALPIGRHQQQRQGWGEGALWSAGTSSGGTQSQGAHTLPGSAADPLTWAHSEGLHQQLCFPELGRAEDCF